MKAIRIFATWVLAGILLAGCAEMPGPYVPARVGAIRDTITSGNLEVLIDTDDREALIGQPILFRVTIRNSGQQALWVPKDPDLLFTWIYPDGRRDNFLREFETERFYDQDDAVLLKPGFQINKYVQIKTYYFERAGITEFRALLHAGRNTNPALTPFWHGEVMSNGYGVLVLDSKKKGYPPRSFSSRVLREPAS
jgi:hypothetical protein